MNKKTCIAAVLLVTAFFVCIMTLYAQPGAAEPGSELDPIVSKSYVDAKIQELTTVAFVPVNASAGQIVIGDEGTEIILRSGSAETYHTGADGIVDITDGAELYNGDAVTRNHLIIIPRADGRGVRLLSDSWLIIKGGYYVTN